MNPICAQLLHKMNKDQENKETIAMNVSVQ